MSLIEVNSYNTLTLILCALLLTNRFNQCYGVFGILDYLHGTDDQFRRGCGYSRHVILLGLTPAKELYPDPPKGQRIQSLKSAAMAEWEQEDTHKLK